jgi:hypothetical protein
MKRKNGRGVIELISKYVHSIIFDTINIYEDIKINIILTFNKQNHSLNCTYNIINNEKKEF